MKAEVKELLEKVEKQVENKVGLVQSIRDIESIGLGLETAFINADNCGDTILKIEKGRMYYADNNSDVMKVNKVLVEKTRENLKAYCSNVNKYFSNRELRDKENDAVVIKSMQNVINYCLEFGFYGRAVELAKLLYQKSKIEDAEIVRKAIEGYARRQLLSGKNYSERVKVVVRDARLGKFGTNVKSYSNEKLKGLFDNYVLKVGKKKFTMKNYQELTNVYPVK